MQIHTYSTKQEMAVHAARCGEEAIANALAEKQEAVIVLATGLSQREMLAELVQTTRIDWTKVTAFHLDEYAGLSFRHAASFRRYLWREFASRLPVPLREFHFIHGEHDCEAECKRLNAKMAAVTVDVAFVGIGENGHLAFNDPPADFMTEEPYIVVQLDDACRMQQVGEGWFASLQETPSKAISMSIRQIMKSRKIVCTVPDERKAAAVARTLKGPISPLAPASILREHADAEMFLDAGAASGL